MTTDQRNRGEASCETLLGSALNDLVGEPAVLSDRELQGRMVDVSRLKRLVDAASARLAGEIATRSGREAGHSGLAARHGHRNAASLVRQLSGSSYREAAALVRVGSAIAAASGGAVDEPGVGAQGVEFGPVVAGLLDATIALDAADGILRSLSPVSGSVDPSAFGSVIGALARESRSTHSDAVARMAASARDTLDRQGVAEREQVLREKRFLRIGPEIDGMRRLSGLLDPESAAVIVSAVDAVTAPRRGGPRFIEVGDRRRAEGVVDDGRSVGQLAVDAVVEMVRIAGEVDDSRVFGATKPAVRVSVDYTDLRRELNDVSRGTRRRRSRSARRLRDESRATRVSSPSCSAERVKCSTSAAHAGCSRVRSASHSPNGMADAGGRGAIGRRPGRKRITSTPGPPVGAPTSTTGYCSAAITICFFTTTVGEWYGQGIRANSR